MHREPRLGRALWIAVLVVLGGYVAADFLRSPFLAPSGSAAVRPAEVTLWLPAADASGGETGGMARGAAAALTLEGHPAVVKELGGGTSRAIASFLERPPREPGANLLVVTSGTLADLAHDRRERLVPGAAEQAALGRALLRRSVPLGVLTSDPLTLAVPRDSAIRHGSQLLASLRATPWRSLFGIADDTWSRSQLASLVSRAGVVGSTRFRVFRSGALAGRGARLGAASAVLATRGALRDDVGAGRLRQLAWPFAGRPPRSWLALVASPGLSPGRLAEVRGWIGGLLRDRRWRAQVAADGGRAGRPGPARLGALLRTESARADRLELLTRRVERP